MGRGTDKPAVLMALYSSILAADPSQVEGLSRFFKTGPGQYGEGDKFLVIKVPVTRLIVKACWKTTGFDDLERCIDFYLSHVHCHPKLNT